MDNKIILEIPMYICPKYDNATFDDLIMEYRDFFIIEEYDSSNIRKILLELVGEEYYYKCCENIINECIKIKKDFNNVKYMEILAEEDKMFYIKLKYGDVIDHLMKKEQNND